MKFFYSFILVSIVFSGLGCSGAAYKRQSYAQLSNQKDFEEEYSVVWKAAMAALSDYKIDDGDEEKGYIETDWVYSTSNEKFIEYKVNGFPKKKYLQARYRFNVKLQKQFGFVKTTVDIEEEVEKLKSDGSFDSWGSVDEKDVNKANEVLKNIELKILSRH